MEQSLFDSASKNNETLLFISPLIVSGPITMTQQKEYSKEETEFIRAVRVNNYEHLHLEDDLVLITDIEGDGDFKPFLSVENDDYDEEIIGEKLEELDWLEWENIEIVEEIGINFNFCDIFDAELNDPMTPIAGEEV